MTWARAQRAQGDIARADGRRLAPTRHPLQVLQRSAGNRAVEMLLQRTSQAGTIAGLSSAKERAESLAKCSVPDLLDTVFDPAFTKMSRTPDLGPAVAALPEADRRRVSLALRSATGPYDEPFYYDFGLVEAGARDAIWDRLQKQKPAVANPTARSAALFTALAGFIRSKSYGSAFKMLNGYSMADILALLVVAHAGNLVTELEAHWAEATEVDVNRLKAAAKAVRLLELYRYLGIQRAPFGPMDAATDRFQIDKYDKELDQQLSAAEPYRGYHDKLRASKAFLVAARTDLDEFAKVAGTLSAPDQAAVNAAFADTAVAGFAATLGDAEAMQGQFVLSSALEGAVKDVLNDQYGKLSLTAPEKAELDQVDAALSTALGGVMVDNPTASYDRVHRAAVALMAKAKKLAAAHAVALDAAFVACLRQAVKAPPAKKSYQAIMAEVFVPLWNQWLDTKSFPDVSKFRNVYQLAYLKMADQWACQPMAMNLAKLYYLKSAGRAKDPKAQLPMTQLYVGTTVLGKDRQGRPTDERVVYRKDLALVVEKMRIALDGGWLLHVRVLSGKAMDYTSSRAAGEHSLMVMGHSGNTFTCADTDPGGEGALHLMTGVATLFFDPGANTLASAVGTAMEVDERGHQTNRHHRYQAWTVQSV